MSTSSFKMVERFRSLDDSATVIALLEKLSSLFYSTFVKHIHAFYYVFKASSDDETLIKPESESIVDSAAEVHQGI